MGKTNLFKLLNIFNQSLHTNQTEADWIRFFSFPTRLYPVTPFCQQIQPPNDRTKETGVQVSCTPDGVSYGFCNLMVHPKPLAPQYVYFVRTKQAGDWSPVQPLSFLEIGNGQTTDAQPLDHVGGKIALANFCPYFQVRLITYCLITPSCVLKSPSSPTFPCSFPGFNLQLLFLNEIRCFVMAGCGNFVMFSV